MTPLTEAMTELRLVVARAEQNRAANDASFATFEDKRIKTMADLFDALDRVETGLGTRLMLAMYPATDAQFERPNLAITPLTAAQTTRMQALSDWLLHARADA